MNGVKHSNSAIEHAQGALDLGREIHVAGCVNNIDTDVAPGACSRSGCNRDSAFLLLLHPIHRRSALMDLSDAVRASGIEQDALRRSGLAGIDVGHNADISATL
jgi:hypothetical protein